MHEADHRQDDDEDADDPSERRREFGQRLVQCRAGFPRGRLLGPGNLAASNVETIGIAHRYLVTVLAVRAAAGSDAVWRGIMPACTMKKAPSLTSDSTKKTAIAVPMPSRWRLVAGCSLI